MPLHGFRMSTNEEENEAWNKIFKATLEEPQNCEVLHAERINIGACDYIHTINWIQNTIVSQLGTLACFSSNEPLLTHIIKSIDWCRRTKLIMERDAPESKLVHICDESLRPPSIQTVDQLEGEMKSMNLNVPNSPDFIFTQLPTPCCFSVPVKCCVLRFAEPILFWSKSINDFVCHQEIALYKCLPTTR
jgi:hypothetical protein